MKRALAFLITLTTLACQLVRSTSNDEYANYYVVIAQTGTNYFPMRREMDKLHALTSLPIDTMGRYFNMERQKLILSESDEDEIYAGSYFPRRFPSENLSIEYLEFYDDKADSLTFALVAGIYETKSKADSAQISLQKIAPETVVLKARIYIGCMH